MKNIWLVIGAGGSFFVAVLHVFVIIKGAEAYRYFGAGEEFARASDAGLLFPAIATSVIVLIFTVLGVYALSGAGVVRALPFFRAVILFTGIVYTLRGLALVVELSAALNLFAWRDGIRAQDPYFSLVSLCLGLIHLWGWRMLRS